MCMPVHCPHPEVHSKCRARLAGPLWYCALACRKPRHARRRRRHELQPRCGRRRSGWSRCGRSNRRTSRQRGTSWSRGKGRLLRLSVGCARGGCELVEAGPRCTACGTWHLACMCVFSSLRQPQVGQSPGVPCRARVDVLWRNTSVCYGLCAHNQCTCVL